MNKYKKIIVIAVILIILSIILLIRQEPLTEINSQDVLFIGITEWKGDSITLDDEDAIAILLNSFKEVRIRRNSLYFGPPRQWKYRININVAGDSSGSRLYDAIHLCNDGKVYKDNFFYRVSDGEIDYDVIKALFQ